MDAVSSCPVTSTTGMSKFTFEARIFRQTSLPLPSGRLDIEEHEVGREVVEGLVGFFDRRDYPHIECGLTQSLLCKKSEGRIVVDDEDTLFREPAGVYSGTADCAHVGRPHPGGVSGREDSVTFSAHLPNDPFRLFCWKC